MKHCFEAPVRMGHKGPAVVFPFEPRVVWGERDRYFVRGTLNGVAVEGEIGFRRGVYYALVDDETLAAARIVPGDTATLALAIRPQDESDPKKAPPLVALRLAPASPHAGEPLHRSRIMLAREESSIVGESATRGVPAKKQAAKQLATRNPKRETPVDKKPAAKKSTAKNAAPKKRASTAADKKQRPRD
jgi:hypothetical protein